MIAVDRTLNIAGVCFVTLLTFHNHDLIRRKTQAAPIFIGPAYLQWEESFQSYHRFFPHLQCMLEIVNFSKETAGDKNCQYC